MSSRGELRPGAVFRHYLYNQDGLVEILQPHLSSLGLPLTSDAYACILVVGLIVTAEDYVLAAASARLLFSRLQAENDPALLRQVVGHLESVAPALRQTRQKISRAISTVDELHSAESAAMVLADVYKRVTEGPFRHYIWCCWSLDGQSWVRPPTITPLRERIVASESWEAGLAETCLLPELRNAEAHEAISWDGHSQSFWADGKFLEFDRVKAATSIARSFTAGCEGAFTLYKSTLDEGPTSRQSQNSEGRHPHAIDGWERAEATFGANNIEVISSDLNRRDAQVVVNSLEGHQINPSFVALLNAQASLPKVETFSIYLADKSMLLYTVSAKSLAVTRPLRDWATSKFSSMPFSTFLPANLDARQRVETQRVAVRSIAWIVIDDVLDALHGTGEPWNRDDRALFVDRVQLASYATEAALTMVNSNDAYRLRLCEETLSALGEALIGLTNWSTAAICDLSCMARMGHYWGTWGPVPRLPGFTLQSDDQGVETPVRRASKVYWY